MPENIKFSQEEKAQVEQFLEDNPDVQIGDSGRRNWHQIIRTWASSNDADETVATRLKGYALALTDKIRAGATSPGYLSRQQRRHREEAAAWQGMGAKAIEKDYGAKYPRSVRRSMAKNLVRFNRNMHNDPFAPANAFNE